MFVITKDFIENYTGDDGNEIVEPVDHLWIFACDFEKEVITPLKNIDGGLGINGEPTLEGLKKLCPFIFRLYDGDDNLYYEGYYDGLEGDEEEAFEPLNWAMADSGCTTLRYLENGEWVEL